MVSGDPAFIGFPSDRSPSTYSIYVCYLGFQESIFLLNSSCISWLEFWNGRTFPHAPFGPQATSMTGNDQSLGCTDFGISQLLPLVLS
jgi:hypothetical protein